MQYARDTPALYPAQSAGAAPRQPRVVLRDKFISKQNAEYLRNLLLTHVPTKMAAEYVNVNFMRALREFAASSPEMESERVVGGETSYNHELREMNLSFYQRMYRLAVNYREKEVSYLDAQFYESHMFPVGYEHLNGHTNPATGEITLDRPLHDIQESHDDRTRKEALEEAAAFGHTDAVQRKNTQEVPALQRAMRYDGFPFWQRTAPAIQQYGDVEEGFQSVELERGNLHRGWDMSRMQRTASL